MSVNATRSEGNTDKLNGYFQGLVDGQKRGMEIMRTIACKEFSKIFAEICPEIFQTNDDIKTMENVFRKKLEK